MSDVLSKLLVIQSFLQVLDTSKSLVPLSISIGSLAFHLVQLLLQIHLAFDHFSSYFLYFFTNSLLYCVGHVQRNPFAFVPVAFVLRWVIAIAIPPPVSLLRMPSNWGIRIGIFRVPPSRMRPVFLVIVCVRAVMSPVSAVMRMVSVEPVSFYRLISFPESFVMISIFILPMPVFS